MRKTIIVENEILIKSIIINEKWTSAPEKDEFFQTLEDIHDNSEPEYKIIMKELIDQYKKVSYKLIQKELEEFINNPDEE